MPFLHLPHPLTLVVTAAAARAAAALHVGAAHGVVAAAAAAAVMAQQEVLLPMVGGSMGRKGIEEKVVIRREGMRKVHRVVVAMWVVARRTRRTTLQLRVWLRCCLRMWRVMRAR
jgi:hypothetical protein